MSRLHSIVGLVLGSAVAASITQNNQLNFAFPTNITKPTSFEISVDTDFVQTTVQKARLYRLSIALQDLPEWEEGPPAQDIQELASYWANDYDWYATQEEINAKFSHFATMIPQGGDYPHAVPLHFVHERAAESNTQGEAIPLLLLHGWPSTHLEWAKVVHPLARPTNASAVRFHVVAPDLPGFGFSPAAQHPGLGIRELGRVFDELMHQLGYEQYAIASTDLGWLVGSWMAVESPSVVAHVTDFMSVMPNATDLERLAKNETSAEETAYMLASQEYQTNHFAYALLHGTKPLSLALAMTDSPVGFLGWVWSLVELASDGYAYAKADLITTTMALYVQGVYGNIRLYKDALTSAVQSFPKSSVPTAVLEFGNPNGPYPKISHLQSVPRDWAERIANVTFFRQHQSGGHFPAISQPDTWLADVRDFFSQL